MIHSFLRLLHLGAGVARVGIVRYFGTTPRDPVQWASLVSKRSFLSYKLVFEALVHQEAIRADMYRCCTVHQLCFSGDKPQRVLLNGEATILRCSCYVKYQSSTAYEVPTPPLFKDFFIWEKYKYRRKLLKLSNLCSRNSQMSPCCQDSKINLKSRRTSHTT